MYAVVHHKHFMVEIDDVKVLNIVTEPWNSERSVWDLQHWE